jgi:hypothetical protein
MVESEAEPACIEQGSPDFHDCSQIAIALSSHTPARAAPAGPNRRGQHSRRMLKSPLFVRLLKKVHMQGGERKAE